jgi:hypothetical protein
MVCFSWYYSGTRVHMLGLPGCMQRLAGLLLPMVLRRQTVLHPISLLLLRALFSEGHRCYELLRSLRN